MQFAKRGCKDYTFLLTDLVNNKQQISGISLTSWSAKVFENNYYYKIKQFWELETLKKNRVIAAISNSPFPRLVFPQHKT